MIRFLDRFVYKNPKAAEDKPRTVNVHKRKRNTHLDSTQLPVTSLEFLQKKTEDLPPHDQFLHRLVPFFIKTIVTIPLDDKKPLFHKYRPSGDTIIRNKKMNQEQIGNRKITLFRTTYDLNTPTIKWDSSYRWSPSLYCP